MLNLNATSTKESFSQALEDSDFRKSDFFPTNPTMMGDNQFKEFVTQVYQAYQAYQDHKHSMFESVFGRLDTMQHILSFTSEDKLNKLAPLRQVNKEWKQVCDGFLNHKWNLVRTILPIAMGDINKINKDRCSIIKFGALSEHICPQSVGGTNLKSTPINRENIEKITYDNALQIVWKEALLTELVRLNVPHLPDTDASAHDIRTFLQNCDALGQVTKLNLIGKNLSVIPPEFNLLTGLTTLYLSENRIEKIQNLSNLPLLTALDLSDNRIETIQNLSDLPRLTHLYLSRNRIEKIQNLSDLPRLTALYLSDNRIETIQNLSDLPRLTHLFLSNNRIKKIQNLSDLPRLTHLFLSNNRIETIQNLSDLPQLTTLSLRDNRIETIQNLSDLPLLTTLSLRDNRIEKIQNLSNLPRLTALFLSENTIEKIQNLSDLPLLTHLYLSNNRIEKIQNLSDLPLLTHLYLSNNRIEKIQNLSDLPLLTTLDLSDNRIEKIQNLSNLPRLNTLFLDGNILMLIPDEIVKKFADNPEIKLFNEQKNYKCTFQLAKLYQAIMKKESSTGLKEVFLSLDPKDRKLILDIIENKTNSSLHSQPAVRLSGMQPLSLIQTQKAFANPDHFYLAVQQSILKKLSSLTTEQKNKVYGKIYELAGSPITTGNLLDWADANAKKHIPRLADALAMCGV